MWGNDFPHHVSTWPESKKLIDEHFADQPDDVRAAVVLRQRPGSVRILVIASLP